MPEQYDLRELAAVYCAGYREAERELYRDKLAAEFDVPATYEELPASERESIRMGLVRVIRAVQPDAEFTRFGR